MDRLALRIDPEICASCLLEAATYGSRVCGHQGCSLAGEWAGKSSEEGERNRVEGSISLVRAENKPRPPSAPPSHRVSLQLCLHFLHIRYKSEPPGSPPPDLEQQQLGSAGGDFREIVELLSQDAGFSPCLYLFDLCVIPPFVWEHLRLVR